MTLGEGSIAQDIFLPNRAAKAGVSEDAMRQSPFDSEERTFRTRVRHVPRETTMNDQWEYQIRVYLEDEFAEVARRNPDDPAIKPLADMLRKHHATMKCQFDAFADYVAEAEKHGTENSPLYKWTKATIENPAKKEKYLKSFTLYVNGNEVYSEEIADALKSDLQPLIGGKLVTRMSKHDTNPANNPQPPTRYRE